MGKRTCNGTLKRLAAFGLTLSLVFSDLPFAFAEGVQTAEEAFILDSDITKEALKEALKEDQELYPEGRFEFFLTQLTVKEGEKQQLVIVRRGGTDQEAAVDFKAVDISASYGEDYLLTVEESDHVTRTLESVGKPLTDFYSQEMPVIEKTEESGKEKKSGKQKEVTPSEGASKEKALTERVKEKSLSESVQEGLKDKKQSKSVLKQARDAYLGTETDSLNWQELDEAHRVSAEKQSENYQKALDQFSEDIYGQEYTFLFKKGEYMKSIYIDTIDDDLSESDEQVMFLLGNASCGEVSGSRTAYLNIKDNDEGEKAVFAMAANQMTVDRSEGGARITVKRVSGVDKIASVIIGTGSMKAVSGTDYQAVQKEVLFAQGVTEQVVEIPLLNYEGAPASSQFQVALDANSSYVQRGAAITTVTLTNQASSAEAEPQGDLSADAAEGWNDVRNLNVSAKVSGRQGGWSGRKEILSGLDLSTAKSIEITWRSNEGSTTCQETQGSGCNKKTVYRTYNNRTNYLYLNDKLVKTDNSFFNQKTFTINLEEGDKTTNANLKLEVHTESKNQNAAAYVTRVSIHYPGYQFTVSNTLYTDKYTENEIEYEYGNQYTEKIYTDDADATKIDPFGHKYKEGNSIALGTLQVSKGDGKFQDSVTIHRPCDKLILRTTYSTNKNSNGVQIKEGASGNVYLAGYQLMQKGGRAWSKVIAPEDVKLTKAFLNTYKDYIFKGNEFKIRAVYRPYEARVMFQNADTSKGSYANGFKTNEVWRCTMLDTIKVTGIAKTGNSVSGFNLGVHKDGYVHNAANSANTLAAKANAYYEQSQAIIESEAKRVSASSYTKSSISNAVTNKMFKNTVTFSPTGEFVYISPVYSVPKIKVKIDPQNNDKEKGSVIYQKENSDGTVDEDSVQMGDYKTPMEIKGVTLNQEYTLNAVTEDNYKAYFKNFTGDADEDGILTTKEQQVVAPYNIVNIASNGNAYSFRPVLDNSLIFYGFVPTVANRYAGYIDGIVQLRDKPVFGSKETVRAVNGAQISVAGQTTVSKYDEKFGGVEEHGGDGYFSIASKDFVAGENQTVNVTYNNLHVTATQAVNAAGIYELDAYDTIGINGADAFRVKGEEAVSIEANSIANGDQTYRFVIQTYSKNNALRAAKAVFRFYRKDGTLIDNTEQEVVSSNGVFTMDFNPATLKIPAGASMTVQFEDQNGTAYYEHEMGITFAQSLGILSFLSSFHFGGAEKALEVIGVIDSAFDFGWDGDIDDIAANSDDGNTKTISIGFEKGMGSNFTFTETIKEAAKNSGTSSEQKERQKEAADGAVTKDGKGSSKNKVKAKIGKVFVKINFGLELNMVKSQEPEHLGEWYFKDMTLAAVIEDGVDVSIFWKTPVGVAVIIGLSTGGEGAATFIVEQNYDKKEYYFSDIMDKDAAKVDIFNFNMNHADRAFDAYGIFTIAPYVDLSAGGGFEFLNLMVGGRADFDMNFYTRKDQANHGDVTFSAYISLKVLFFTKKWNMASTTVNMFGAASGINELAGDADYTYTSLSEMEIDNRSYRANRSEWKGEELLRAQSNADTNGITETLLQEAVNPEPDIQMVNLPNDQYMAVFLDDTPGEDTYNCTHVYYSIYSDGTWSKPELIEKDGTLDDEPAVFDLGERGIYVAWSSADRILTEDDTVIDSLNSMNIHGAFFNPSTKSFGEIQEITKTAPYSYEEDDFTMEDNIADVKPHISYDEATGQMLLFYTKTEYESTSGDDEGLVGDIAKPYSLMAYRIYDFATGTWDETYDASEGVSEDYQKAWYGQRFLELAPLAVVNEELDASGFWTKQPEIKPFENAVYENADGTMSENEPIVLESESATYNGLALYAYVLDYDGDQETENDRDIFLQIYDYQSRQFTHPVMMTTTPDLAESKVKFVRSGDVTLLTYLADNTLYAMNVSVLKNGLLKSEIEGQEFYYIDKSAPPEILEGEQYVYLPPVIVAGDRLADIAEDNEEESKEEPASIADYEVASDDDYIYAVWTKRATKVKEGIDPTGSEATDAANRVAESQIYIARYDWKEEVFTEPVQVTEEEGANYGSIGFALEQGEEGKFKLLATKAKSTVETVEGKDETGTVIKKEILTEDTVNKNLMALEFAPTSTLEVQDVKIEELSAGAESYITMQLYNDGVETLENLTLTAEKEDGTKICEQKIASSDAGEENLQKIYGGTKYPLSFPITLDENEKGCSITYKVTDISGKVLAQGSYSEKIPVQLDVTEFEATQDQRGTIQFRVHVQNNGRRKSGAEKIQIARKIEGVEQKYKDITSIATEPLMPGESASYTAEYAYGDYSEMFETFITEDSEKFEAVTSFRAYVNQDSESAIDELVMQASKEQRLRMTAVRDVSIMDGTFEEIGKSYTMKKGEITQLNTSVDSIAYKGSRYEGTDDEKHYDASNTAGLKVMYTTDNANVLTVYDSGYVEAVGTGTAHVKAYLMPANNKVTYTVEEGSFEEDNFATMPEEAIIINSFEVKVEDSARENKKKLKDCTVTLSKSSYNYDGKTKKPDVTVKTKSGGKLVKGSDYKVTYSSGRKNAGSYQVTVTGIGNYTGTVKKTFKITISKGKTYKAANCSYKVTKLPTGKKPGTVTLAKGAGKSARTLEIKDSVKIGGKSFQVTAVGTGAFKNYEKATKAVIGKNVKVISSDAFAGCKKLKLVTVQSKTVSKVGNNAFKNISLKAVIEVPASKLKAYKEKFDKKAGIRSTMKIKKK